MKTYIANSKDSFASIAQKFNVKNEDFLKTYHNLNCPIEDVVHGEIKAGTKIVIPEEPELLGNTDTKLYFTEEKESPSKIDEEDFYYEEDEGTDTMESYDETKNKKSSQEKPPKDKSEQIDDGDSSEHEGKYFVIQKGTCQCDKGFQFPKLKVSSHQKHYWNDAETEADYLAVTEDDLTFDPASAPFGNCKLRPSSGGYLPCVYAPAGKWQKTYDKVKIMKKSCVTEISELMCATGGKITILKHGQQSEATKSQFTNTHSMEQQTYNPAVDFDEFKEEIDTNNQTYYI